MQRAKTIGIPTNSAVSIGPIFFGAFFCAGRASFAFIFSCLARTALPIARDATRVCALGRVVIYVELETRKAQNVVADIELAL